MKKILFFIHNLGPGGAEKVLVNLANALDPDKFEVTVLSLFDEGVNRQFLASHIRYQYCFKKMFRGNSHVVKLLSPRMLHRWYIKEKYDIEVAFLEGPSSRIISGCPHLDTKLVSWIHCYPNRTDNVTLGFRSYQEAEQAYGRFHQVVCVSDTAVAGFQQVFPKLPAPTVLYNVNDSDHIHNLAQEPVDLPATDGLRLVTVGRLIPVKAMDRLIRIHAKLRSEGYPLTTCILGAGALESELIELSRTLNVSNSVSFLGYQTNPYKYVAKCDLFVCSSLSEGFSTAATEALIVGTPVCTVEVSGMKELLGENNEYGIVTENDEQALYEGIKRLLDDPALMAHYKKQAALRGKAFEKNQTVKAAEEMLLALEG
ncbi:MAG: glycosyltransferase [Ruminococcaceae bacterium]|nr:glycosyltransferase [Oscillospiraceae bacterium]